MTDLYYPDEDEIARLTGQRPGRVGELDLGREYARDIVRMLEAPLRPARVVARPPIPPYFLQLTRAAAGSPPKVGAQFSVQTQQNARQAVLQGWQKRFPGTTPNLETLQAVQSIGAHEGSYGMGWRSGNSPVSGQPWNMVGSNNWGAVMCKATPQNGVCPGGCGLYTDSHPTAQGQKKFDACFIRYASPADGAAGIVAILQHMPKVLAALPYGNLDEIAWQMREAHYFEGFSTDHRTAARQYAAALDKQAKDIATALGEPQAAYRKGENWQPGTPNNGNGGGYGPSGDNTWIWLPPVAVAVGVGLVKLLVR